MTMDPSFVPAPQNSDLVPSDQLHSGTAAQPEAAAAQPVATQPAVAQPAPHRASDPAAQDPAVQAQAAQDQAAQPQAAQPQAAQDQAAQAKQAQAKQAQAKTAQTKRSGAASSSSKTSLVQAARIRKSSKAKAQASTAPPRSMAAQFTAARALADSQRTGWALAEGLELDLSSPSLQLWHEAIALSDLCHEATQQSQSRCYGLMAEIRWGASLIPAHVADGCGLTAPARPNSLQSAYAALLELKTHLQVAQHTQALPAPTHASPLSQWEVVAQQLRQLLNIAAA